MILKMNKGKCYQGYGWYPIGLLSPIGMLDSEDWGEKVIKCPVCKAGHNTNDIRYGTLMKHFNRKK